ncbi:MAG: hypothetical protein R6U89_05565 [Dehalococcoidia bacterium]
MTTTSGYRNIWARLTEAELALENALADPDIQAALAPYGYDEARLQEGKDLFSEGRELAVKQQSEYGQQYGSTESLYNSWEEANKSYMNCLKVARIALRDYTAAEAALMLSGDRKNSFSGWHEQAQTFYGNLLGTPEYLEEMARFGYTQESICAEASLVQAVIEANLEQEARKGLAQDATRSRDDKMDELDQWMSDFKTIAIMALEPDSQTLEKLGFGAIP